MTFDDQEKLSSELIQRYETASQDEKILLQLISVFYEFVSPQKLLDAMKRVSRLFSPDMRIKIPGRAEYFVPVS